MSFSSLRLPVLLLVAFSTGQDCPETFGGIPESQGAVRCGQETSCPNGCTGPGWVYYGLSLTWYRKYFGPGAITCNDASFNGCDINPFFDSLCLIVKDPTRVFVLCLHVIMMHHLSIIQLGACRDVTRCYVCINLNMYIIPNYFCVCLWYRAMVDFGIDCRLN